MKITLEVNDVGKAGILMEFLKSLNYVQISVPKTTKFLPDWHIAVLQQRLKDYKKNPKDAMDLDKAIDEIESKL